MQCCCVAVKEYKPQSRKDAEKTYLLNSPYSTTFFTFAFCLLPFIFYLLSLFKK